MHKTLLAACVILAAPSFAATPADWRSRSIYQVLTDRFALTPAANSSSTNCDLHNYCGGTWKGIEAHLDYIQALGFDAVWVSPVIDNWPGGYHGYWQRDMYAPNSNFGDFQALRSLSDGLHARGMALMVDVVANHAYSDGDVSQNSPFNLTSNYHDCNNCPSGCNVNNYEDHIQMEHCRLAGLYDFDNTDITGEVATTLLSWVKFLVNVTGADGLRVDTTPYVFPAFWRAFEAAAGVYAVGEVDSGDLPFVAPYQGGALSGVLSYPLFFTLRNVFGSQASMRALGQAWRDGLGAYKDPSLLGVFTDNHDNPRFMNAQKDVGLYRGALAYSILSDGIPIVYYGSEWLLSGGGDPDCREALWESAGGGGGGGGGNPYDAASAPLGPFITTLNAHRKSAQLWGPGSEQVERWQDDQFYAFSKGNTTLACFTNVGSNGGSQTRSVTYLPPAWAPGTKLCNVLDCKVCATVQEGPVIEVGVEGGEGVAVYSIDTPQC